MKRLCLFAGLCAIVGCPGSSAAQRLLFKPGDVIAGKTLTGASEPSINSADEVAFRGTFMENGQERIGFFGLNTTFGTSRLVASTLEPFHGYALHDIRQPAFSYDGKEFLFRGVVDQGPGIFSERGKEVLAGEEIRPGVTAVDPHDPVFGGNLQSVFFDKTGIYSVDSRAVVSTFPSVFDTKTITGVLPSSASIDWRGVVTFVNDAQTVVAAADLDDGYKGLYVDSKFTPGNSPQSDLTDYVGGESHYGYIATVSGRSTVVLDQKLRFREGDVIGAQTLGVIDGITMGQAPIAPNFVFSSEGRFFSIHVPEPSSFVLALIGSALGLAWALRKCRGP